MFDRKAYAREYARKRRADNSELVREKDRQRYAADPTRFQEKARQQYKRNSEYQKAYMRTYYTNLQARDPELAAERKAKRRVYGKEYQRRKRELDPTIRIKDRIAQAKRRKDNPEKAQEISSRSKKKARQERPHLHLAQWLWWAYRMKPEQYEEKFHAQYGVCAFCSKDNGDKRLVVDHDHNKPKGEGNRWLLCTPCNLLIANARENSDTLRIAAERLDEYHGRA